MTVQRSPEEIQREIEEARASLATTVDKLAERTSPKRLADLAKQNLIAWTKTPKGRAVVGGTTLLITFLIAARVRAVRRRTY
ncbi:MAG TPA: DUF3618 domain-containing protein [Micromonosporaceae bacterium]